MKKWLWRALGLLFVGLAYIGAVTPGVPTTFFALLAAWAFSKSSPELDKWLHEHKIFGKYLTNWETKRIYPQRGRIMMVVVMCISLISMFFTVPLRVVGYAAFTFTLICIWAFRYPGSEVEYDKRVKQGKKIGWLK
jgi:uncharacterized membrane protein YbaN (DUF454 family)